jgi:YbbR domain-containing protein
MLISNWPLKLTALLVSVLLWAVAASEEPATRILTVALVITPPPGRSASWTPGTARILVVGSGRELLKLAASPVQLTRALPDTVTGRHATIELSPGDLELPRGINVHVQDIEPRQISVELDSVFRRMVPVHPAVSVVADSGFAVAGGVQIVPGTVTLLGPANQVRRLDSVSTVSLRLTGADGAVERQLAIDTTGFGLLRVAPATVTVSVDIVPASERSYPSLPVDLPDEWASTITVEPDRVTVKVRGALERLRALPPDSIHVFVESSEGPVGGWASVGIAVPPGFSASVQPDSVRLARRGRP